MSILAVVDRLFVGHFVGTLHPKREFSKRIEVAVIRNGNAGGGFKACGLMLPNRGVAHQTRYKNEMRSRHPRRRIC